MGFSCFGRFSLRRLLVFLLVIATIGGTPLNLAAVRQEVVSIAQATTTMNSNMKNTGGRFPWPCEGRITSGFGMRWGRMHKGVDIANLSGTPIYSVADGVVTVAKTDPGGFGFYIVIDHGRGISTLYAHMYPSTVKVQVGQQVKKGQLIAEIGSNGHSTGSHLHFEVHVNNKPVDPMSFLMKR